MVVGAGVAGQEALSRNHINILTSDVVVALPGGPGTASEVRLALHYGKPVVLFLGEVRATALRQPRHCAPGRQQRVKVPRHISMCTLATSFLPWAYRE